jgi:hypothetical protein
MIRRPRWAAKTRGRRRRAPRTTVQFHAAPDSNVSPAPARPLHGPAPTPVRRVARSLLSSCLVRVLLLAAVSSMSACIIPLAPDFQDPPPDPQGAPYFVDGSATPAFGALAPPLTPTRPLEFYVYVGASSPGTTLWWRWALDYPPFMSGITFAPPQQPLSPPASGQPGRIDITLDCTDNANPSVGLEHQLFLLVANQPFIVTSPPTLDTVADPTPDSVISNSWPVDISCGVTTGGTQ